MQTETATDDENDPASLAPGDDTLVDALPLRAPGYDVPGLDLAMRGDDPDAPRRFYDSVNPTCDCMEPLK